MLKTAFRNIMSHHKFCREIKNSFTVVGQKARNPTKHTLSLLNMLGTYFFSCRIFSSVSFLPMFEELWWQNSYTKLVIIDY
jgi:hypothetical protein